MSLDNILNNCVHNSWFYRETSTWQPYPTIVNVHKLRDFNLPMVSTHLESIILFCCPAGEVPPARTIYRSLGTSSLSGCAFVSAYGRRNLQRPLILAPACAIDCFEGVIKLCITSNHSPFILRSWGIKLDKLLQVTPLVSDREECQLRCLPPGPRALSLNSVQWVAYAVWKADSRRLPS